MPGLALRLLHCCWGCALDCPVPHCAGLPRFPHLELRLRTVADAVMPMTQYGYIVTVGSARLPALPVVPHTLFAFHALVPLQFIPRLPRITATCIAVTVMPRLARLTCRLGLPTLPRLHRITPHIAFCYAAHTAHARALHTFTRAHLHSCTHAHGLHIHAHTHTLYGSLLRLRCARFAHTRYTHALRYAGWLQLVVTLHTVGYILVTRGLHTHLRFTFTHYYGLHTHTHLCCCLGLRLHTRCFGHTHILHTLPLRLYIRSHTHIHTGFTYGCCLCTGLRASGLVWLLHTALHTRTRTAWHVRCGLRTRTLPHCTPRLHTRYTAAAYAQVLYSTRTHTHARTHRFARVTRRTHCLVCAHTLPAVAHHTHWRAFTHVQHTFTPRTVYSSHAGIAYTRLHCSTHALRLRCRAHTPSALFGVATHTPHAHAHTTLPHVTHTHLGCVAFAYVPR